MSLKCKDIIEMIETVAPLSYAMDWDNVGLLVGDEEVYIKKILVALDATDEVIDEAIEKDVDMIITHHPMIFGELKKINLYTYVGKKIIKLIKNDIALYSAHTNLDIAKNGTNDRLAEILELENVRPLMIEEKREQIPLARIGYLSEEVEFSKLISFVKDKLKLDAIKYVGDLNRMVKTVSICTGAGSGNSFFYAAKEAGVDVHITGDVKFHEAQEAINMGLCVIDATHYATEQPIVERIAEYLEECTSDSNIEIIKSEIDGQVFKYMT